MFDQAIMAKWISEMVRNVTNVAYLYALFRDPCGWWCLVKYLWVLPLGYIVSFFIRYILG